MMHGCSRVILAARKSLHGCGIVCWCIQPGKPGATYNPLMILGVQSWTSKASGNDGFANKDRKQKEQLTLQDRVKCLIVTLAGGRAQDGTCIYSSRERFLTSLYSLQTQPENRETKTEESKTETRFDESSETIASENYDTSSSVTVGKCCTPLSVPQPELKESSKSEESDKVQEEFPLNTDLASHQAEDNRSKYTQTDYWINIPSFQDRLKRLRAPFWRTSVSSDSETDGEASLGERTESVEHLKPNNAHGLEYKEQQTRYQSRNADSMKPESLDVTAEAQAENPLDQQLPEYNDKSGTLSLKTGVYLPGSMTVQNVIKSIPRLKSAEGKTKEKRDRKSAQGLNDSDAFDLKGSPIVYMNVALQEEPVVVGGGSSQVSPVKEMEKQARMAKDKAMKADVAAKKPRKQLKPVISKTSVDDRTRNLAIGIHSSTTNSLRLLKLERLAAHLTQYPESREVAIKEKLIPTLLKVRTSWDIALMEQVNEMLAHLGYAAPVKGRGLRILSIDGGGTRGVIAIETLREIERRTDKPVRELFDYVIGVSSGAVLGFLLAFDGASLDECEELYRELSQEVFKRNTLLGTSKLFLSHAFYDTEGWIKILKSHSLGDVPMIFTARQKACPKVAAVATLMNVGSIKDFLFRNYNLPPGTQSHYRGACKYELWQAARASSAAPGYFEECKLDDYVFQDGGVLTNNPCALAIHECRLLWPDTPIQCVVSVGCGRYDPEDGHAEPEYSSLKKKLTNIMVSATDTESVHTVLQDLLPSGRYFRFNPSIIEDYLLDEDRAEKIEQMQQEARDYLDLNELKLVQVSGVLSRRKTHFHKALDWLRLQHLLMGM